MSRLGIPVKEAIGVYKLENGDWRIRVTIKVSNCIVKDIVKTLPKFYMLNEVVEERNKFKDEVLKQMESKPEYVEILDKNGEIIYGMKRDKFIDIKSKRKSKNVDAFFEEVFGVKETLDNLFDTDTVIMSDNIVLNRTELLGFLDLISEGMNQYSKALSYITSVDGFSYSTQQKENLDLLGLIRKKISDVRERYDLE